MKQILGLWLLFYIPTTLAEVYTCVYKGNTVYQSKPCAGTVAKNNINYSQKSLTDRQKYEQWKSTREPKVGMSGDQVIKTTVGELLKRNVRLAQIEVKTSFCIIQN
ncbi:hypothetical protein L291_2844 [Acinetobacter guillouiae MSP4-18]|uniref:DUF4124 domain-containing protein n=1 Tax=Acinetobacter guillouiae TaxID=106649 RepID=UPI0002CF5DE0|nr:DUF4124 domain-containing protein [Acinetobacter guillouiae]ENU59663.1 hypothetical protein F981_01761 [Acinetobacter guillouiae CIP 63.46]EPH33552.1 hypothetical protein L291_2844 [Acinetobacter guillouiae MSP4-18]KAB0627748.1 DUF4124 domain-containing protein [Acinetobacter guillouiae]